MRFEDYHFNFDNPAEVEKFACEFLPNREEQKDFVKVLKERLLAPAATLDDELAPIDPRAAVELEMEKLYEW